MMGLEQIHKVELKVKAFAQIKKEDG